MQNFRALGAPPQTPVPPAAGGFAPKPPASGSWGLSPHTPIGFWRLGAPPPDPLNRVVMYMACSVHRGHVTAL